MSSDDTTLEIILERSLEEEQFDPRGLIRCRLCNAAITHQQERIHIDGQHEHRFTNPHDIRFHLACFSSAPGCAIAGKPTPAFSWFQGFYWQYALCCECQEHVGWYYEDAQKNNFFGLILAKLEPSG